MKHRAICCINGDSGQWCLSEMFLNLVFAYCTSEHLPKVPDTAMSMIQTSPSPQFLLRQPSPTGLSYHCCISLQAVSTFTNLVLYHMWVCSIILKSILQLFFFALWPFKLVFAAPLCRTWRTIALWGNLSLI